MKKTPAPTPTPWTTAPTVHSQRINIFGVAPNKERHIGTLISGSRTELHEFRANAEFIIHACNCFCGMLEALGHASDGLTAASPHPHAQQVRIRKIRAAIAKAKGGAP